MKKIIVAILALVYITTSAGATIRLHYCMGELAGWGLRSNNSNTCSNCGMRKSDEKENGCCKDKLTFVKNNADQNFTEIGVLIIQVLAEALPISFIEIHSNDFLSVTEENPISHPPPRSSNIAVYIRNCVFLL